MVATSDVSEADARSPVSGFFPRNAAEGDASPWTTHVEWGPAHMLNDVGPATVIVTAEDVAREANALTVQAAVERAIEKGEEYEYDE